LRACGVNGKKGLAGKIIKKDLLRKGEEHKCRYGGKHGEGAMLFWTGGGRDMTLQIKEKVMVSP